MANGEGIRQLILGPVLCGGASLGLGAMSLLLPEQPYLVTAVSSSPSRLKKMSIQVLTLFLSFIPASPRAPICTDFIYTHNIHHIYVFIYIHTPAHALSDTHTHTPFQETRVAASEPRSLGRTRGAGLAPQL